jgi:hypothetical protein
MELGELGQKELAQLIIGYKQHTKELKDELEGVEGEYKEIEKELIKRYEEEGQTSGTFIGDDQRRHTLYVSRQLNPISKFSYGDCEMSEKFFEMLDGMGMSHLRERTAGEAMKSFRSTCKEYFETDGKLPDNIEPFVEVRTDFKIGMRSS